MTFLGRVGGRRHAYIGADGGGGGCCRCCNVYSTNTQAEHCCTLRCMFWLLVDCVSRFCSSSVPVRSLALSLFSRVLSACFFFFVFPMHSPPSFSPLSFQSVFFKYFYVFLFLSGQAPSVIKRCHKTHTNKNQISENTATAAAYKRSPWSPTKNVEQFFVQQCWKRKKNPLLVWALFVQSVFVLTSRHK